MITQNNRTFLGTPLLQSINMLFGMVKQKFQVKGVEGFFF